MSLPVYQDYSKSDIPWIGQRPAHWKEKPAFAVCAEDSIKNTDGKETTVLSLSYGRIVVRDVEKNFGLLPESFNTYQIVNSSDIVLRLTDLQNDKRSLRVGLARQRGIITSAYLKLTCKQELDPEYAYQLLHAYDITKVFYGMGGGLRQSMKFADFRRLPILVPPLTEQQAIARFLDHETAKIDQLIAKQKRLVELLKEKRQAVISHAVTKGLNPDAKMKDSGVEWLGEVPRHWEICRFKNAFKIKQGLPFKSNDYVEHSNVVNVRMGNIKKGGKVDLAHNAKYLPSEYSKLYSEYELHEGDMIIAMTDMSPSLEFLAVPAVMENLEPTSKYLLNQRVGKLEIYSDIDSEFVKYLLLSSSLRNQLKGKGLGTVQANMSNEDLYTSFFALPSISEQKSISSFLSSRLGKIDITITKSLKLVSLLTERRSALISAAVTGKIYVRDWQPESTFAETDSAAV